MDTSTQGKIAVTISGEGSEKIKWRISAVLQFSADGPPRIMELTVRSAEGSEIPPEAASNIDFGMLAGALGGAVSAMWHNPKMSRTPKASRTPKESQVGKIPLATADGGAGQRPYRKMPDVEEVKGVYLETGSVGKLAHHYGVPRYTAQAWVDRLRRLGHIEQLVKPAG